MKRIIPILLALALTLTLCACGDKAQDGQIFGSDSLPFGNLQRAEFQHAVTFGRKRTHLDGIHCRKPEAFFEILLGKIDVTVDKPAFDQRISLGRTGA